MLTLDAPLDAKPVIVDGRQRVLVQSGPQPSLEDPPALPWLLSRTPPPPDTPGLVEARSGEYRVLGTLEPATYNRCSFATVPDLVRYRDRTPPRLLAEAHTPYLERILIDAPEWFARRRHGPLIPMTVDIEQLTGPKIQDGQIISIGFGIGDGEPEVLLNDDKDLAEGEARILREFHNVVRRYDPDVLLGYNHVHYDVPLIQERARRHGLGWDLSRTRPRGVPRTEPGEILGRVLFDVFEHVRLDQTLHGIKDRKLKTVAEHRGVDVIREDTRFTAKLVGTQRLAEYNASDVRATWAVGVPYLELMTALAETYGAPLGVVNDATPSFHVAMLQGRVNARRGVVSPGRNDERHGELYAATDGEGFVGGLVRLHRRGLFHPVTKVDFASMYPSIIVSLGLGADTVRLAGQEPFGPFEAHGGKPLRLHIPDPSRNVRHVVEVQERSGLADELERLLQTRLALKHSAATPGAHAKQAALKVVLNSVYGVMGSAHARYGDLAVAIATVGVARYLTEMVEATMGEAAVETDTDGIYAAGPVDAAALQRAVDAAIARLGGKPVVRLEAATCRSGWFHAPKCYVLLHDDGRLEIHGVAFKGSHRCRLFDDSIDAVARAILGGGDADEAAARALRLGDAEPDAFVMRVKLGKRLQDYAGEHLAAQVARSSQRKGHVPRRGDVLPYVKSHQGYEYVGGDGDPAFQRLDHAYYQDMLRDALHRLGLGAAGQATLTEF